MIGRFGVVFFIVPIADKMKSEGGSWATHGPASSFFFKSLKESRPNPRKKYEHGVCLQIDHRGENCDKQAWRENPSKPPKKSPKWHAGKEKGEAREKEHEQKKKETVFVPEAHGSSLL
jgi:hypothetical protein